MQVFVAVQISTVGNTEELAATVESIHTCKRLGIECLGVVYYQLIAILLSKCLDIPLFQAVVVDVQECFIIILLDIFGYFQSFINMIEGKMEKSNMFQT